MKAFVHLNRRIVPRVNLCIGKSLQLLQLWIEYWIQLLQPQYNTATYSRHGLANSKTLFMARSIVTISRGRYKVFRLHFLRVEARCIINIQFADAITNCNYQRLQVAHLIYSLSFEEEAVDTAAAGVNFLSSIARIILLINYTASVSLHVLINCC